ncbi:MAG TPA: hypothetical protein VFV98_05030 [Vicinamibacterales bacterium]|nr:hypothetical protein [Vicinamibacterales bacterium]
MRWARFVLGVLLAILLVWAANFVLQHATQATGPLLFGGLIIALVLFLGAALVLAFSLAALFRR